MSFKINQTPWYNMDGTPTKKAGSPGQQHAITTSGHTMSSASDKDLANSPGHLLLEQFYEVDGKLQRLLLVDEVKACYDTDSKAVPTQFTIVLPKETVIIRDYVFLSENCTIDVLHESVVGQLRKFHCDEKGFEVFRSDCHGSPMTEKSFQILVKRNYSKWKLTVRPKKGRHLQSSSEI